MRLSTQNQRDVLKEYAPTFTGMLEESQGTSSFKAIGIKVIQINVGKICNQACHHCHVDASPRRKETMSAEVVRQCIALIESLEEVETVDITGGAPEINEHFTFLVEASRKAGKHVIDRCNLTILEEEGYKYLYEFLKKNEVEIIASLPHYSASRTDSQRGRGVFERSITALQTLNALGYGNPNVDSPLTLNLVYNPSGLFLSGSQEQLEREFKENLFRTHRVTFDHLYCLNNLPISRFLESLLRKNKFQEYMDLLKDSFNRQTVNNLMCRYQLSIGYDGRIYDCDFNQMLEMPSVHVGHLDDWTDEKKDVMRERVIQLGNHCYGCTAGTGSSCGGSLT